MLDKVLAPELIADTVENSILPYAEEHHIPFDELLLQYIKVNLRHSLTGDSTLYFPSVQWHLFFSSISSSLGSAGALQFSDHNPVHRVGSQSSGCTWLHDRYWCRFPSNTSLTTQFTTCSRFMSAGIWVENQTCLHSNRKARNKMERNGYVPNLTLLYFLSADGGCCAGDHAESCRTLE